MRSSAELLSWIQERRAALVVNTPVVQLSPQEAVAHVKARAKIEKTTVSDAERISRLPVWDENDFADLDLTPRFKTPNGTMRLNFLQNAALYWIEQKRGLLGLIGAGAGKTIISLLAPRVLNAVRPVLFIPPSMQLPLQRTMEDLREHFVLPKNLLVIPYSQLSVASSTDLLDRIRPDLIVFDECHSVANESASRTKRILRYFRSYPQTRAVMLSGTLTGKGLSDYGHLSELSLREGSPLPINEKDLQAWSACVDSESRINDRNMPKEADWSTFAQFCDLRHIEDHRRRREEARAVFSKRLRTTPGVVASKEGTVGCSLFIHTREVSIPDSVAESLTELRKTWTRPDGEELVSALDLFRAEMEMSQGFFNRWAWPDNEVDHEWMLARSMWHREVRAVLNRNMVGMDSPLLITRAVMRLTGMDRLALEGGGRIDGISTTLCHAWEQWDKQRHKPKPPTEIVWIDTFLIEDAMRWRVLHPKGIIWFGSKAVEQALRVCGERVYGAGEDPKIDGKGVCLSIASFGTGFNLQPWSESLVMSWPTSGKIAEQLLARTHRQGQKADEVHYHLYAHTTAARLAVQKSKLDARYIEQSVGAKQRLLSAAWVEDA